MVSHITAKQPLLVGRQPHLLSLLSIYINDITFILFIIIITVSIKWTFYTLEDLKWDKLA